MYENSGDIVELTIYVEAYLKHAGREEDSEEFRRELEIIYEKSSENDPGIAWKLSRTHRVEGVLLLNWEENKCVLLAENQRAMGDLLRKIPENQEVIFYFEQKYQDMVSEYVCSTEDSEQPCRLKGYKASMGRLIQGNGSLIPHIEILSKKHPVVAELKEYQSLNGRMKNEKFVVEGMRLVKRALADGLLVEKVIYIPQKAQEEDISQVMELCKKRKIMCCETTAGIMPSMTATNPVPEIICTVRMKIRSQKDIIFAGARNFFLILDGISNPDNLGIILRTADAAGISGVILLSNSVHFLNKNAVRGARGAMGKIPVFYSDNDEELFCKLSEKNFKVIGTSARFEAHSFYDIDYKSGNVAVVIGNESEGVRKEILARCTGYAKIPMAEGQSSLNIAVAAALMMYEYVRAESGLEVH